MQMLTTISQIFKPCKNGDVLEIHVNSYSNIVLSDVASTTRTQTEQLCSRTRREEGGEIVEDLRVPLPSCETHHWADVEREGLQLLPRAQAVHFQHILHVVEETHKQEAGVCAGGEHCREEETEKVHVPPILIFYQNGSHESCSSSPITSLSCWGMSSFQLLWAGEAKSMLMRR